MTVNYGDTFTPGPDVSVANYPLSVLDHLHRLTYLEFLDRGGVVPSVPFWWDFPMFDITNTMVMAIRNGHRTGARAFSLYWGCVVMRKWKPAVDACKELQCAIMTVRDPTYERKVWWIP